MKKLIRFTFATLALCLLGNTSAVAAPERDLSEYNIPSGLGLKGYDPVSIFPEGGSEPKAGKAAIALRHEGVTYRFAAETNREIFKENPAKYEPTYGGWCAYAMASGSKVDIQPTIYTVHGNRAHYFVGKRAKQNFDNDINAYEVKADQNWKRVSGEEPRF